MKCIFTIALFVILVNCTAQHKSETVTYLDKNCNVTTNIGNAVYYRLVDKQDDKYVVRDYYKSTESLEMQAICSSVSPKVVFDGEVVWYYENGNLKKEGYYKDGNKRGLFKFYFENGSLQSELIFSEKETLYCQYYNIDGAPLLVNGTGFIIDSEKEFLYSTHNEIKDSLLVSAYSISGNDTIYSRVEKSPEYQGGFPVFYQELSVNLKGKYPIKARRQGIEGKVFIQFDIDDKGIIRNAHVVKGIGGGCDEVALEAFQKQTKWIPGINKGKPVRTVMVLPVVFKLT